MRLAAKQHRFSYLIGALLVWAYESNFKVSFGHAYRDYETQKKLFDMGRSDTMKSKHMDRLAIDLNLFIKGCSGKYYYTDKPMDYLAIGTYWEMLGHSEGQKQETRWGGRIKLKNGGTDPGHFEFIGK